MSDSSPNAVHLTTNTNGRNSGILMLNLRRMYMAIELALLIIVAIEYVSIVWPTKNRMEDTLTLPHSHHNETTTPPHPTVHTDMPTDFGLHLSSLGNGRGDGLGNGLRRVKGRRGGRTLPVCRNAISRLGSSRGTARVVVERERRLTAMSVGERGIMRERETYPRPYHPRGYNNTPPQCPSPSARDTDMMLADHSFTQFRFRS